MSKTKRETHWIPLADLMTVLMVIFLLMSISYMVMKNKPIKEYKESKEKLYNELKNVFEKDFDKWQLKLDNDLSIKFTNPQVLFKEGSSEITPRFKSILSDFLPKYLNIVLQEKYRGKIAEIRIEGHTDTIPIDMNGDPYIDNMKLSQDRARNVLAFLRSQKYYISLSDDKKSLLQYWITANGLSYGRTVDKNDSLTFKSKLKINNEKSRRVEFRIVTSSDYIIEKEIKNINKQ